MKKLKRVNESDETIVKVIKELELDILDYYIYGRDKGFKDAAEYSAKNNGYVYYNTMYGNEQAICINVKGRPRLDVDIPDDMYDEVDELVNIEIDDFARDLKEEDNSFMIVGRSGGYWGYKLEYKDIDSFIINQKGIEKLKKTITSLIKEKYGDAELNYDEVNDFVYEELGIIADALDDKCIEIKKEIFDKLKSLETLIDDKEKEINDIVEDYIYQNSVNESCGKRKPKKPFPRKSLKESAKDRFLKKAASKSKLSESKKEREEYLKKTFDDFKTHLIDAYSYLGGAISIGKAINKDLSDYPQEIQDFMAEIDLNKLNEIHDNMRPIVKGAAKTFYDTYGW